MHQYKSANNNIWPIFAERQKTMLVIVGTDGSLLDEFRWEIFVSLFRSDPNLDFLAVGSGSGFTRRLDPDPVFFSKDPHQQSW